MAQAYVLVKYYTNGQISNFPIRVTKRLFDWDLALAPNKPLGFELATAVPGQTLTDQEDLKRREVELWDATGTKAYKVVCPKETARLWMGTDTGVTAMPVGGPMSATTVTATAYARQGERVRAARHFGEDA